MECGRASPGAGVTLIHGHTLSASGGREPGPDLWRSATYSWKHPWAFHTWRSQQCLGGHSPRWQLGSHHLECTFPGTDRYPALTTHRSHTCTRSTYLSK